MEDFTSFKYPFKYPDTAYVQPPKHESHGEFLQAAVFRYKISAALHALDVDKLKFVLEFIKNLNEPVAKE